MIKKDIIIREIFYFLAISLAVFLLLEIIFPDIVQTYFNLNILLSLFLLSILGIFLFKKQ